MTKSLADFDAKQSRCWANSLGDCQAMSGEHVVSSAVFGAGCSCPILIEGVQRIRGGSPTPNAEKSNILCRRHNSMLSPLDELAGRVASFQAQANEENFEDSLTIEGELLERWLVKTVVNAAAAGWIGSRKFRPSPEIVSAIFGQTPIPHGLGLYSVDGIDPNHRPSGGASITPIFSDASENPVLFGAYVAVHGMPLFVAFNTDIAQRLEAGEIPHLQQRFADTGLKHLHHPGAIVMSRKLGKPVIIALSWNGLLRFADGTTAPFPAT
jgi:hypothetical protein